MSKNLVAKFNEEQRLEREEQVREELELEDLYFSYLEYDQYCPCGCCNDSYLDEYLDEDLDLELDTDPDMSCFDPSDYGW
jgi:hypothetical protein